VPHNRYILWAMEADKTVVSILSSDQAKPHFALLTHDGYLPILAHPKPLSHSISVENRPQNMRISVSDQPWQKPLYGQCIPRDTNIQCLIIKVVRRLF